MVDKKINEIIMAVSNLDIVKNNYSLIDSLGYSRNEVKITQLLFSLLNDDNNSRYYDRCLQDFIELVLGFTLEDFNVKSSKDIFVDREYTFETGRMDLLIYSSYLYAPIEVKIDAEDQDEQCSRYLNYAQHRNESESYVYYLTIDGKKPSDKAFNKNTIDTDRNFIKTISFKNEILSWLNQCQQYDTNESSFSTGVRQIIFDIERLIEEKEHDEAMKKILMNDNCFKEEAIQIADYVRDNQSEHEKIIFRELSRAVLDSVQNSALKAKDTLADLDTKSVEILNINDVEENLRLTFNLEYKDNLYIGVRLHSLENENEENKELTISNHLNTIVNEVLCLPNFKDNHNSAKNETNLITWTRIEKQPGKKFHFRNEYFTTDMFEQMRLKSVEMFKAIECKLNKERSL